jgi:UDP-GlcNAc:undecaprenyl-phosphate GlcNAc-1-phosphate transferase
MMPLLQISIAFFIGLITVFYAIPVIVRISAAKNFYDVPNERKVNSTIVPNLGGIAIFVGISIGTLLSILRHPFPDWRYISAAMMILFFIGFKDDILVISARKKFAAQFICAIILVFLGDMRIVNFHGIFGISDINYTMSVIITLIAFVGTINALNLIDGIDGLAAAIGIMGTLILGSVFFTTNQINYAVMSFSTAGSLISFFAYNVFGGKNKIFMGDTGSLILGLTLSVCAIEYNETAIKGNQEIIKNAPLVILALLAVPLFDMARIFVVRIFKGKSPFSPDMNHIHHYFLRLGFTHLETTLIITISNIIILGIIIFLSDHNINLLLIVLLILVGLLLTLPIAAVRYGKFHYSGAHRDRFQTLFIPNRKSINSKLKTIPKEKTIPLNELVGDEGQDEINKKFSRK